MLYDCIIGGSDALATNATAKPSESSAAQRNARVVPKAPISQPPPVSSDAAAPTTPAKGMLLLLM
jgi:hypothetical protein